MRALLFRICRSRVTFPAVSDGPNSVRCWMLCSVLKLCSVCWNVHWKGQPHTTVSLEELTSVWCLLRWKKATTFLFLFSQQQQASTSSSSVSGCRMGDGGGWSSCSAQHSLEMQMGSSIHPLGCCLSSMCCSLTQGELWGGDGGKEGAALIPIPQ